MATPKVDLKNSLSIVILLFVVILVFYTLQKLGIIPHLFKTTEEKADETAQEEVDKTTKKPTVPNVSPTTGKKFLTISETGSPFEMGSTIAKSMANKYKKTVTRELKTSSVVNRNISLIWEAIPTPLEVPNPIYWVDNPQQIESVFKSLIYKSQVQQLAEEFQKQKKRNLLSWLQDKLDTATQKEVLARIITYTNSLPSGYSI
jgi:hypothetical protein